MLLAYMRELASLGFKLNMLLPEDGSR